jgi:hypothetical protein
MFLPQKLYEISVAGRYGVNMFLRQECMCALDEVFKASNYLCEVLRSEDTSTDQ